LVHLKELASNSQHLYCCCARCWLPCGTILTTCTSFNHVQLLSLMNQNFAHQKWHLHFSQCCHCRSNASGFFSLILCNSRICHLWCASSQRRNYCDWHLIDQFFPLAIKVFEWLHKHIDVFLHNCANAIWSLKRFESLHLFIFVTFFH
jgi:hypothetical protein